MKLQSLEVNNFRSLKHVRINFHPLTILIGENDAGKSSVLDILDIALGNGVPDENDYYYDFSTDTTSSGESRKNKIEINMEFIVSKNEETNLQFSINKLVTVKKIWTIDNSESFYKGHKFINETLNQDFSKLKKDELESLIMSLEPSMLSELKNNEQRASWLEEYSSTCETCEDWIPISSRSKLILPRFERYKAMDYSNPENIVMKTLKQVFEGVIFENNNDDGDSNPKKLDKRLLDVKNEAEEQIIIKVQELLKYIGRYVPSIQNLSFEPVIDFSNGLRSGEFKIDTGRGFHYLSKVGDGTKRRIFMGTLDWDREISMELIDKDADLPSIIRGYDEPDTNLHYEAQRKMFSTIEDIAYASGSNIQIILCTHSLTMIDRAQTKSINLLKLIESNTHIEKLNTDDDPSIESFLTELAQEMGITNTIMFYERCYILIEGETEANALPILYRKIFSRGILEDGIRIINVKGNGATKEFLRLLCKNKQEITIVFLDNDTKIDENGRRAKLTEQEFKEAGFSDDFITERIQYIGEKEFEDAFDDETICNALNQGYPKDTDKWNITDITSIRTTKKISDEIGKIVFENSTKATLKWGKPEFGKCLGKVCEPDKIPNKVIELFELAQKIANN